MMAASDRAKAIKSGKKSEVEKFTSFRPNAGGGTKKKTRPKKKK